MPSIQFSMTKMHSTQLPELLLKYLQYQEDNKVSTCVDNAFLGEIPKRIAICMMDNDSCDGNYKKNPFNFQHYNLTQIGISVNGEEVPFKPLRFNFDDKLFVTAYSTLFSGTGKLHGNSVSIVKREDYSEGYTIIVADLTPFETGDISI